MGILVFLAYRMRRVDCRRRGVTVELVPWGDGRSRPTAHRWYRAGWAERLSWSGVGSILRTSWDGACRAAGHAVGWGRAQRDLGGVTAQGIDEVARRRGHTYMTPAYDIGGATERLLAASEHRTEASSRDCPGGLGRPACRGVRFACSGMWRPYLRVIRQGLGPAAHVPDRFHVMQQFGEASGEIRAGEVKELMKDGYEPVVKKSRWWLLKRPEN